MLLVSCLEVKNARRAVSEKRERPGQRLPAGGREPSIVCGKIHILEMNAADANVAELDALFFFTSYDGGIPRPHRPTDLQETSHRFEEHYCFLRIEPLSTTHHTWNLERELMGRICERAHAGIILGLLEVKGWLSHTKKRPPFSVREKSGLGHGEE